jgi:hypothetical protein
MIVQSFQGLNQKQTKIMLEEQFMTIGNSIAKKMSEMNLASKSSLATGSITSQIWIPAKIADHTYTVQLSDHKIILESSSDPYVTVEIPINSDIRLAENSKIYSSDYKYVLQYDSQSDSIFFENGGVEPVTDFLAPTISIDSPLDGTTIQNTTTIYVTVWDNVRVTKVEYQVDESPIYTATGPFNWAWNTKTISDGIHNVTAIAYDGAGNTKPDTKSYNISNPVTFPPNVTVISPPDNSTTDFRKPVIQAKISDDVGINFSSISLLVDGVNKIGNASYANVSQQLTTITYIPSQDMDNSTHNLSVHVKDTDNSSEVMTNWSFTINITGIITDADYPTVSIISPITNASLKSGDPISVDYSASDNSSGLDNISINVTRNDGFVSKCNINNISIYPTVIKTKSSTCIFPDNYVGGMSYTYNITVFDRSGKNKSATVGPLIIPPGQASELEVITTGKTLPSPYKVLGGITLRDTSPSDTVVVTIKNLTVSWIANSSEKITRVRMDGTTRWRNSGSYTPSGSQPSGTQLTINSPFTADGTAKVMELTFDSNMLGKSFIITFYLSDGTTKTVTFNT